MQKVFTKSGKHRVFADHGTIESPDLLVVPPSQSNRPDFKKSIINQIVALGSKLDDIEFMLQKQSQEIEEIQDTLLKLTRKANRGR